MIAPADEKKHTGTRIAVAFDHQGKRVKLTGSSDRPAPQVCLTPDDERSAIKQAIVRWLNET